MASLRLEGSLIRRIKLAASDLEKIVMLLLS